jgi:hypothetical protein
MAAALLLAEASGLPVAGECGREFEVLSVRGGQNADGGVEIGLGG